MANLKKKKKKIKYQFLKLRPFDKWRFDLEKQSLTKLLKTNPKAYDYYMRYTRETLNGSIDKTKSSVFTLAACKKRLAKIKNDPEAYEVFLERQRAWQLKYKKKISPLAFVKIEFQREMNRDVNSRRFDAYATSPVTQSANNLKQKRIDDKKFMEYATQKLRRRESDEEELFLKCVQQNRLDLFVNTLLIQVCDLETPREPKFKKLLEELTDWRERYPEEMDKTVYLFRMFTAFLMCSHFARDSESKKLLKLVNNTYTNLIYPMGKNKKLKASTGI